AFVAGQAVCCLLAFSLGAAASPDRDKPFPTLQALLVITLGGALIGAAVYVRRRRREPRPLLFNPRAEALRARLSSLNLWTALGTGLILGFGGPKRIGITILVGATIEASDVSNASSLTLAVLYVAIATVLVWVPVSLYVVFGTRAADWLTAGQHRVAAHKDALMFWPSAVLGVGLVIDGLVQLVA
ncbi:MAG: GAP family protein, partial [Acidimicrobiia bacterium]